MENNRPKIYLGFITYGESTAKYLPYFLPSLTNQTFQDFKIVAVDNSQARENENSSYLRNNFPEIDLKWAGENFGFAKAFNLMIAQAFAAGAEYFLALNPDMILEDDAVEKLVAVMEDNHKLGSASGKILRWDFENNIKTNIIDSCGIKLVSGLRFFDVGQGKLDKGQYDNIEILGPSGACAIYRLSALEKVGKNGQYLDELMFMYKEDCDLAYRLFLAGFKSKCVCDSIIYHDRSSGGAGESNLAVALNRKNKSRQAKQWAFLNQQIIFIKYWRRQNWLNKLAIIWFEIKMLIFVSFFEPYLFKQFVVLFKIKSKIIMYG